MTVKFPKALGECIDQMYLLRAKRLDAQKAVDALKAEESMYEEHILNTFTKVSLNGAKGDVATYLRGRVSKVFPRGDKLIVRGRRRGKERR